MTTLVPREMLMTGRDRGKELTRRHYFLHFVRKCCLVDPAVFVKREDLHRAYVAYLQDMRAVTWQLTRRQFDASVRLLLGDLPHSGNAAPRGGDPAALLFEHWNGITFTGRC